MVSPAVMTILDKSTLDGRSLRLPPDQLERPLYEAVNKVIVAAGGKWNRSAKAHLFECDAIDTIEPILLTGEYTRTKQDFGQFDTPDHIATAVVTMLADLQPGMTVLEPSAGIGNLAMAAENRGGMVMAYELDAKRLERCRQRCALVEGSDERDFLTVEPRACYDRVIMNPPFAKQADISHVMHAFGFLKPGGVLVAIMSAGVTFRSDAKTRLFQNFAADGVIERLPSNAFKESGTGVNAVTVRVTK